MHELGQINKIRILRASKMARCMLISLQGAGVGPGCIRTVHVGCMSRIPDQNLLHLQLLASAMQEEAEADPLEFVKWLEKGLERIGAHVMHTSSGKPRAFCLPCFPFHLLRPCPLSLLISKSYAPYPRTTCSCNAEVPTEKRGCEDKA